MAPVTERESAMWQRMMQVWLLGTAVTVIALDGAPPELPPPPDIQVEQRAEIPTDEAGHKDQGIRT
jgi:hypothetical protein